MNSKGRPAEQERYVNDVIPGSPTFSLVPLQQSVPLSPSDGITALGAIKEVLWIGTERGRVFWWNTQKDKLQEVASRTGNAFNTRVHKIFAEKFSGGALILSGDDHLFYGTSGPKGPRLREIRVASGLGIRVLSWVVVRSGEFDGGENVKGTELIAMIGCLHGELYALRLDQVRKRDTIRRVWNTPRNERIDGICVERVADKFIGAVATFSSLYLFNGRDTLTSMYSGKPKVYSNVMKLDNESEVEMVRNGLRSHPLPSLLQFMSAVRYNSTASRKFVWAHDSGLFFAQLAVYRSQSDKKEDIEANVADKGIIRWSTLKNDSGSSAPLACNISLFHVLVLYPATLLAYSNISGELVHKVVLWDPSLRTISGGDARLLEAPAAGFSRDVGADSLWVFTSDRHIARMRVSSKEEQFDAWKVAKNYGRFDLALTLAPTSVARVEEQVSESVNGRKQVLKSQAEQYAKEGDYLSAVRLYAKTSEPLEGICLKIMGRSDKHDERETYRLLIEYLVRKLDDIELNQYSQRTAVSIILVELYGSLLKMVQKSNKKKEVATLRKDFLAFLADHHHEIHLRTAIEILSSRDCLDEALHLAMLQENAISAVDVCLLKKDYVEAVEVSRAPFLQKQQRKSDRVDVLSYMTTLVAAMVPGELAQAWKDCANIGNTGLDDLLLVTTLLSIVKSGTAENAKAVQPVEGAYRAGIDYIESRLMQPRFQQVLMKTSGAPRPSIQREQKYTREATQASLADELVIALFELHALSGGEEGAIKSFRKISPKNPEVQLIVLESCHRSGFQQLQVDVLKSLGRYEEAIAISLELDCQLAEEIVSTIPAGSIDRHRLRNLWCRVAEKSLDSMKLLSKSRNVLRIEDILPIMPRFEHISQEVQQAVLNSVEQNKEAAQNAKASSESTAKSIAHLKSDIDKARSLQQKVRKSKLGNVQKFPCGHSIQGTTVQECVLCGPTAIESIDTSLTGRQTN